MMYGGYSGYYGLLGILVLVLDIIAIASVLGGSSTLERKLMWTAIVLILPVVGMILYYMIGKSGKDAITV